jgi:hypothetical protein
LLVQAKFRSQNSPAFRGDCVIHARKCSESLDDVQANR